MTQLSLAGRRHAFSVVRSLLALKLFGMIFAVAVLTGSLAQPAIGWCSAIGTNWNTTSVDTGIRTSIPDAWDQTMSNVLFDWNNVAGSALHYNGPVLHDGYPNRPHTISKIDFNLAGFPDIPGNTTWSSGATHTWSYVYLNQSWTWNLTGIMNQAQKKADVHTVTLHEVGHSSGLDHPDVCGLPLTTAETNAVMNVQYVKKWDLNSDDKAGLATLY